MDDRVLWEQFERLSMQLNVARAYLLQQGGLERMKDARELLRAVGRGVEEIIDLSIDPALGWRRRDLTEAAAARHA